MENKQYVITKKMKILLLISIPIAVVTMVFFLVSIYKFKSNEALIYISMILFIMAMMFEFGVIIYCLKEWFKVYKEKYKDFE